jgi:hypothetical protein
MPETGYLPRLVARTVRQALASFPAVLVTGARQAGKTTMQRHEFGASFRYVSLERPDLGLERWPTPWALSRATLRP